MALKEIGYEYPDEETYASKARINEALSYLRKLLTPECTYNILPEELKNSDFPRMEKEKLLLSILHYAKHRTNIADNVALMKIISDVKTKLNG